MKEYPLRQTACMGDRQKHTYIKVITRRSDEITNF